MKKIYIFALMSERNVSLVTQMVILIIVIKNVELN